MTKRKEKKKRKRKEKRKTWKMKNTPSRAWDMARKLTNEDDEKSTLYDLEYGKTH
jgi:hypothetical protein